MIPLKGGKVIGGKEFPLYEKTIRFDPAFAIESVLTMLAKHHDKILLSSVSPDGSVTLLAEKITLETLKASEHVGDVFVAPKPAGRSPYVM